MKRTDSRTLVYHNTSRLKDGHIKIIIINCKVYWCIMLFSTISQSYHSDKFYWWRKSGEYDDVPQITDKLDHMELYQIHGKKIGIFD